MKLLSITAKFRIQSLSPLKKKIQELNTNIIKELNEKGKPNTEFDNIKFEEGRINKTKEVGLL